LGLLSGCAASVHPLCDPATAEPDKRLVGLWERRDGEDASHVSYLHIAREPTRALDTSRAEPEPGLMRCGATGHDEKTLVGDDFGSGRFLCTKIGYLDYASIVIDDLAQQANRDKQEEPAAGAASPAGVPGQKPRFLIVRYDVTDDVLVVWPANQDDVAQSIESKQIAGVARRKVRQPGQLEFGKWEEVTLTASTEDLRKFFEAGGAEKWFREDTKTVYHRLQ
jgi:hypothetical protein